MVWKIIKLVMVIVSAQIVVLFLCSTVLAQGINIDPPRVHSAKIFGVPVEAPVDVTDKEPAGAAKLPTHSPKEKLDARGKMKYGLEKAFLSPGTYAFPALTSISQQLRANEPNKDTGDEVADGFSRYAINYGRAATKALFANGIYPIVFKQQPRYEPATKKGFRARALHAASRVFVTRGDNGNPQFNASLIAGNLTASALANTWEQNTPGRDRIGVAPTFRRFATMVAFDVIKYIVLKEFAPELKKMWPGR